MTERVPNIVSGKVARHQPVPEGAQRRALTPSAEFSGVRAYIPEQRAAIAEERVRSVAPLKFYRWCGIVIVVIGIAGFVWEQRQS